MNDILNHVMAGLSEKYDMEIVNDKEHFIVNDALIRVSYVKGLSGIVVEYAGNKEAAEHYMYEDGDVHTGDDADQILQEILEEIET